MMSFIFGMAAMAFGLWGVWAWQEDFIHFLKGCIPISLFLSGVLAVIIGLISWGKKPHPALGKKDHEKA